MKKLFQLILAAAMVMSFMPIAEAGETAQLGLSVTFASNEPLKIWSEPAGPFEVKEGEALEFKVIAEDKDAMNVILEASQLPEGATFVLAQYYTSPNRVEGTFRWTPKSGQGQYYYPYLAIFKAVNNDGEIAGLEVSITVKPAPVISIELVDYNGQPVSAWELKGIKLGEKKDNSAYAWYYWAPLHNIKNSGNIAVSVDIGYGPLIAQGVQPGTQQGLDTFITGLGRVDNHILLEPNGRLEVGSVLAGQVIPLWLTYGAPTQLSPGVKNHGVTYELRAYGQTNP